MEFDEKLSQMCDRAEAQSSAELGRAIDRLSKLLASILRDERWDALTNADQRALAEAVTAAREAAMTEDAAIYVGEKLLNAANGTVRDIRLIRGDLDAAQQEIYEAFESGDVSKRGLVYVAWCKKPERFFYVGKANSVDRLKLAAHGNLVEARREATLLSILFPMQSKEDILLGLEASVIELVRFCTGEMPALNKKREKVPPGSGRQKLSFLADFLSAVGNDLDKKQ